MKEYDLVIIGGGSAAFGAAIRANELHAATAMANEGLPLGGTCVNVGCVPSKTLLRAGEVLHLAKSHAIPGIDLQVTHFDFGKAIRDELALVEKLRNEKYEKVLKGLEHVTLFEGKARFISQKEIDVNGKTLKGKKFVIATGSTAGAPPIEGIREVGFLTHVEALKLERQPKEMIVVGAGPLGLEFAQMYARFGTKVTLLERLDTLFPPSEKELVDRLATIFSQEGITVRTGVAVKRAWRTNGKKMLSYVVDGKEEEISAEEILLATGKTPNTQLLDLKNAGVEIDKRKAIVVNGFLQTSQPCIFAAGDVINLPLRVEITAAHEGTLAAENALNNSQKGIDYDTVPYTIFTDPELAGVGFTENEQMKRIGVCECRTVSFADVPRAIITKRTEGLIKMAIHPETRRIMGVHLLAPHAGELVSEAMMLVRNKNTLDEVIDSLPMFPTLSESIKIAALSFGKDISKLSCCV